MKVFLQTKNGQFINENVHCAYYGFNQLGYDILPVDDTAWYKPIACLQENPKKSIVVGHIGFVLDALEFLGVEKPKAMEIPEELYPYLGRKIWKTTLGEIHKSENFPVFIKPLKHKQFTGHVVRSFADLIKTSMLEFNSEVMASEVVDFVSEYRGFVLGGQLIGCKNYAGDFMKTPNYPLIRSAIKEIKNPISAYSIDFGVTNDGYTRLIELNDSYSLGCYGLRPDLYCKMIETRWKELTK